MKKKFTVCLLTVGLLVSGVCIAGFNDGMAAAQKGDFATAINEWLPLADQGNADAQYSLGVMYADGNGVTMNEAQAVQWYRKAADQGHADAQYNLGKMYESGKGVVKDEAQAVQWFRKAADQGMEDAQNNLGIMYANGKGVTKDKVQAAQWFRKAADQGGASAQNQLGWLYMDGSGVLQDYTAAADWFKKSASQGDAYGQRSLGMAYRDGKGVTENLILAYSWLNLAAAGGRPVAKEERDEVAVNLTEKELQQAQQLSSKWSIGTLIKEVAYKPKKTKKTVVEADAPSAADQFPSRPAKRSGVTSCNTQCTNADCYRTYDNGKKIRFRAKQKWDPFESTFKWDSGPC